MDKQPVQVETSVQVMQQVFVVICCQPLYGTYILCKYFIFVNSFGHIFQEYNNMFIDQHPKVNKIISRIVLVICRCNPFLLVVNNKGFCFILPNHKTPDNTLCRIN